MNQRTSGTIQIKKRAFPEWAMLCISAMPLLLSLFVELLGLPNGLRFLIDVLLVASVAIVLLRALYSGALGLSRETRSITILVSAFFLYTLVLYLLHYESAWYYIWGVRNNFRFYVAFFLFIYFLTERDVNLLWKLMDVAFVFHIAASVIQYFMDYEQDYIGGIFGVQKGCNGYAAIFISIVVMKSLLLFMDGKEAALPCFFKCGAALLSASIAEIKIFFIFFIIIVVISAVTTSFSARKTLLILGIGFLFVAAYTLLTSLYEIFRGFLSFESLLDQLFSENYANEEDIGRFTAIPAICDRFLISFREQLFGMGLGNCEVSSIDLFNTDFANKHIDVHYSVFSVAFMFLETGYVGLTLFTLFFVFVFVYSFLNYRQRRGNMLFNQMGIIMSVLCLILMFYNASLRTEAGYMVYFVLALPYIGVLQSEREEQ